MFRVWCIVAILSNSAFAQREFETQTHWQADLSKNIFSVGTFDASDNNQRPRGWDDFGSLDSGQLRAGGGTAELQLSSEGGEASFGTTIDLPAGTDYLTFFVRMRGPQMVRGKSELSGGGVVFSLTNVFGDTREMPRLDPTYSGYRDWNEFMTTTRVKNGESKLSVRVEIVDVKGKLEVDDILIIPSVPGFQPTSDQEIALQKALKVDDGELIAKLIKDEPRLIELRTGARDNCTLLGLAVWHDAASVAGELIRAGVDREAVDYNWGNTPLGWACLQGRKEVAKVLIEGGAETEGYAALAQRAKSSRGWPHRSPADFDAISRYIEERIEREQHQRDDTK